MNKINHALSHALFPEPHQDQGCDTVIHAIALRSQVDVEFDSLGEYISSHTPGSIVFSKGLYVEFHVKAIFDTEFEI